MHSAFLSEVALRAVTIADYIQDQKSPSAF